jgi:hypothetical protein
VVRHHLSKQLIEAGIELLGATDALDMQAQGAMWIYHHALEEWRYYLVTSLVDTIGRRKTYRLLLDVFEQINFPKEMTIEDVHLGSPSEPFFQLVSQVVGIKDGVVEFKNCLFNDVKFDGIVYRSVRSPPPPNEAERIEKRFQKRVKDLSRN